MTRRRDSGARYPMIGAWFLAVSIGMTQESAVVASENVPPVVPSAGDCPARWYSDEQVAEGKRLFAALCAECHGKDAAATPDWRRPDANGNYPPPPLNGSAHTWHHSLEVLRETIQNGGAPLGGVMPGFADRLSMQEIDAVIAWIQSLWPEEVYRVWSRMNCKSDE